jgi:hypothetical protein
LFEELPILKNVEGDPDIAYFIAIFHLETVGKPGNQTRVGPAKIQVPNFGRKEKFRQD